MHNILYFTYPYCCVAHKLFSNIDKYVVTTYLFPLSIDNDDSVAVEVIIGSVLGACAIVVIVIVITLIIMRNINNKLAARVNSSNEYTGPPRVSRSYNLYVYVLHA